MHPARRQPVGIVYVCAWWSQNAPRITHPAVHSIGHRLLTYTRTQAPKHASQFPARACQKDAYRAALDTLDRDLPERGPTRSVEDGGYTAAAAAYR